MADPLVFIGIIALAIIVAAAILTPERTVMAVGLFLFVQSAIIRVDAVPDLIRSSLSRLDEVILLALTIRYVAAQIAHRNLRLPVPLWALAGLAAVGIASTIANGVPLVQAAVGLFLALKAGLWLFVGSQIRVDRKVLMRYLTALAVLFLAAVGLALLQVAGLTLPWEPHLRRSGELAATSIWNQHTVFGSAMAVLAGLSVAFLRLANWRRFGLVLAAATGTGIVLSTVRRLLISIPLAAAVVLKASESGASTALRKSARALLGPKRLLVPLAALAVVIIVAVGPRMTHVVADTWDEYVVHAATRDRYALYRGGFTLAIRSPVVGRGPGTYGSYASVLFNSPAYQEAQVREPDSLKLGAPYASLIAEFGIAGAIAFATFIVLMAIRLRPLLRSADLIVRSISGAALFMVIDMTIESLVHPTFSDSFVAFFAMSAVGISLKPLSAASGAGHPTDDGGPIEGPDLRWLGISIVGSVALILGLIVIVQLLSPATSPG